MDPVGLHRAYRGKLETGIRVPVEGMLAYWYTPGVAEASKTIASDPAESLELTWRWNTVAVVSDGTRVLGLGDVGPEAALPVMEGKALLFKYLGGVDAVPLVVRERSVEGLVRLVKALEPSFGGVNIEDVESPKCFELMERLRRELNIPVWHDDQQGTALVVLAALYTALKLTGRRLEDARIVVVGAGAAGTAVVRYLLLAGARPGNIVVLDSKGVIHRGRRGLNKWKRWIAENTNTEGITGGGEEAFRGADVAIGLSRPGAIRREWVRLMNDDAIVFALANPVPEIWPEDAREAGARIVATGRSDLPNQVNNSLGFPAVFRGALSAWASKITDSMCLAAARALAEYVEEKGASEDYIIPSMEEQEAYVREAVAVARKAYEEGVARRREPLSVVEEEIRMMIERPKKTLKALMESGLIRPMA